MIIEKQFRYLSGKPYTEELGELDFNNGLLYVSVNNLSHEDYGCDMEVDESYTKELYLKMKEYFEC